MQTHSCSRLGDTERFLWIGRKRVAGFHVAKTTVTSTHIAEQHERGRAPHPTFTDVRTGGFLANSMQIQIIDQLLNARRRFLGRGSNQPWPGHQTRRDLAHEHAAKSSSETVFDCLHRHWLPQGRPHGCDAPAAQAARDDQLKVRHVGINIKRQSVSRHPILHRHSYRRDLISSDPDARVPL